MGRRRFDIDQYTLTFVSDNSVLPTLSLRLQHHKWTRTVMNGKDIRVRYDDTNDDINARLVVVITISFVIDVSGQFKLACLL